MKTEKFKANILGSFTVLCPKGFTPVPFYGPSVIIKKKNAVILCYSYWLQGCFYNSKYTYVATIPHTLQHTASSPHHFHRSLLTEDFPLCLSKESESSRQPDSCIYTVMSKKQGTSHPYMKNICRPT